MSLFICSLNSGSNANCYYVGNEQEAILIDAGLSCRETEKRMLGKKLPIDSVKAIFISHEHADHVTGLAGLSKKYQLPVYITDKTFQNCSVPVDPLLIRNFQHAKTVTIGNLSVIPFRKKHDAADPHSFIIRQNTTTVGVITDIGYACKQVIHYFQQCEAVFLESNYCDNLLEKGNYPYHLKKRIKGDDGHLSNLQALELFQLYKGADLQVLILSHLSKNNNKPELVEAAFKPHAGKTKIIVASRYEASDVFKIEGALQKTIVQIKKKRHKDERQLSLF